MTVYKIVNTCELFGSSYEAGAYIGLNEDQERELKVGKFVQEIPDQKALRRDPKSNAKIKVGNKNLVKAKESEIEGLDARALESGAILYPPQGNPIARGTSPGNGIHATQFQTMR